MEEKKALRVAIRKGWGMAMLAVDVEEGYDIAFYLDREQWCAACLSNRADEFIRRFPLLFAMKKRQKGPRYARLLMVQSKQGTIKTLEQTFEVEVNDKGIEQPKEEPEKRRRWWQRRRN